MKKTFNDIIENGSLDEMLENTKKLCSVKLNRQNITLPVYIDKEDVIQDAMIKVSNAFKKYNPKKASANTYFTRIIDNVIIDNIRKYILQQSFDVFDKQTEEICDAAVNLYTGNHTYKFMKDDYETANKTSKKALVQVIEYNREEDDLFRELVLNLKNLITERERKILELRYAGYTHQEVAEKLKVSRPTVAKDWLRIRDMVLDSIKKED